MTMTTRTVLSRSLRGLACSLLLMTAMPSEAAWWGFGKAAGEPMLTDLRFNQVDALRVDESLVLAPEDLGNGMLTLRGRAEVRKGKIGLVEVSTDGGANWQPATLGDRGMFTWEFRPQVDRKYDFRIRALTTTGQSTAEGEHDFTLAVSTLDVGDEARKALEQLVAAYQREDQTAFFRGVSDDFQGNRSAFEEAVARDFRLLDNIRLQPVISRVARMDRNVEVYLTFNRQVLSSTSGQLVKDAAATTATFSRTADGLKLVRLTAPVLFGVTDPEEVASGVTLDAIGQNVLVVDSKGQVSTGKQGSTVEPASGSTETGTVTLAPQQGWQFETQEKLTGQGQQPVGDIYLMFGEVVPGNGVVWQRLTGTLDSTTSAPESGYQTGPIFNLAAGQLLAFQMPGPRYALIEVTSFVFGPMGATLTFRYKYQPGGGRQF